MNDKIKQILIEGKKCQKRMVCVGPTGPTGPTGSTAEASFVEIHTITGYPLSFTTPGETLPVNFDAQDILHGNYGFEPGTVSVNPYEITPGVLIVNEPGFYEIHYDFSNVMSTVDGEYHIFVLNNGSSIENATSLVNLIADKQTAISNTVYTYLPAGSRISMSVTGHQVGQFIIGGNMNQLLIKKLADV